MSVGRIVGERPMSQQDFHARARAYRRTAARMGKLAGSMHVADCRDELLDLARRFERLATHVEHCKPPASEPALAVS
jgi:hypothetical protein